MAWIIYDENFKEVKRENHYLKNCNISISKNALKIHKITPEFLQVNGEQKEQILLKLADDLYLYKPLVVGHFIEFDFHILNAEFYRIGKANSLNHLHFFCTMKASAPYVKNPTITELKLNKFCELLFNEEPKNLHNAIYDVINTSKIFFYLYNLHQSNTESFLHQFAFEPRKEIKAIKGLNYKNNISQIFYIFSLLWKTK